MFYSVKREARGAISPIWGSNINTIHRIDAIIAYILPTRYLWLMKYALHRQLYGFSEKYSSPKLNILCLGKKRLVCYLSTGEASLKPFFLHVLKGSVALPALTFLSVSKPIKAATLPRLDDTLELVTSFELPEYRFSIW